MQYGYARVSTDDQDSALKLTALQQAGCEKVFTDDGKSGATITHRPALQRCVRILQEGDTLVVWKLDRLARNLRDLVALVEDFNRREIQFVPHRGDQRPHQGAS